MSQHSRWERNMCKKRGKSQNESHAKICGKPDDSRVPRCYSSRQITAFFLLICVCFVWPCLKLMCVVLTTPNGRTGHHVAATLPQRCTSQLVFSVSFFLHFSFFLFVTFSLSLPLVWEEKSPDGDWFFECWHLCLRSLVLLFLCAEQVRHTNIMMRSAVPYRRHWLEPLIDRSCTPHTATHNRTKQVLKKARRQRLLRSGVESHLGDVWDLKAELCGKSQDTTNRTTLIWRETMLLLHSGDG